MEGVCIREFTRVSRVKSETLGAIWQPTKGAWIDSFEKFMKTEKSCEMQDKKKGVRLGVSGEINKKSLSGGTRAHRLELLPQHQHSLLTVRHELLEILIS